jgi:hypothetical protein
MRITVRAPPIGAGPEPGKTRKRRIEMSGPLKDEEIVVTVPQGTAKHVRVEEAATKSAGGSPEITVRVSNKRKYDVSVPILGVIVK